jgi:hypothetical protein
MMEIQRTIKYDADRVKGFGKEVMSVPGCEQLEASPPAGLTPPTRVGQANSLLRENG